MGPRFSHVVVDQDSSWHDIDDIESDYNNSIELDGMSMDG